MIAVILIAIAVPMANDLQKMYTAGLILSIALIVSILAFKQTFPFFLMAILSYWMAVMSEVWTNSFLTPDDIKNLMSFGNVMFSLGLIFLFIRQILKNTK